MTSQDWTNLAVVDLENAVDEARVGHLTEARRMARIGSQRLAWADQERVLRNATHGEAKSFPERLAEVVFGLVIVGGAIYFFGHVIAAWLRGSFAAVR